MTLLKVLSLGAGRIANLSGIARPHHDTYLVWDDEEGRIFLKPVGASAEGSDGSL